MRTPPPSLPPALPAVLRQAVTLDVDVKGKTFSG
jgi:hypothetical protein